MPVSPTITPPCTDPRDSLRQATAALHARVDACMPLARSEVTLADYQHHLALLHEWIGRLHLHSTALAPRLSHEALALDADLHKCRPLLAHAKSREPSEFPQDSPALASLDNASAQDWGIAYVLEGSRLGGQVLYRRLSESLAPHPLDYLRGAGAETGARWKAFLARLKNALDTPERVRSACDGAVMAFDLLLQCHAERARPAETTR